MVSERDDIAAAALAEDEVGAGDDARGAVATQQQFGDEILGGRRGERRVERQDEKVATIAGRPSSCAWRTARPTTA